MKKIIVLTMLVLLAIGMPVMAVDFGGDFTIKAGSNFKEGYEDCFDLTLDVSQAVDDYNTVSYELELRSDLKDNYADAGVVDNPKLVTDLGAALGLPDAVGVVVTSGIFESGSQEFASLTGYGVENVAYVSAACHGGAELLLTFADLVNVEMASDFDGSALNWLVGTYGTVGPVSAEVFYGCAGDNLAEGELALGAALSQELGIVALDVGAGFEYDLSVEDGAIAEQWKYGVGVAASADVGVAVNGGVGLMGTSVTDHILEAVGIDLGVVPLEDLGIDVGLYLNTYTKATGDTTPMLDHVDFSVWKDFGAANYRVGYLYSAKAPDNGSGSLNAPFNGADIDGGGFYMNVDINY